MNNKSISQVIEYQLGIFPDKYFEMGDVDKLGEKIKSEMQFKSALILPQPVGSLPRLTVASSDGEIEVQISPEKMNLIFRVSGGKTSIEYNDFIRSVEKFIALKVFKDFEISRIGFVTTTIVEPKNDNFKFFSNKILSSDLSDNVINLGSVIDYQFSEGSFEKFMRFAVDTVQNAETQQKAIRIHTDISNLEDIRLKLKLSKIMDTLSELSTSVFLLNKTKIFGE